MRGYIIGQLLISAHKHYEYFDITYAQCREL